MVKTDVGRIAPARQMRPVKISGLATYVPPRVMTNADLEKLVATTDEWIQHRTGIRERHIAEPGVGTSELATVAAEGAMKEAGITAADVVLPLADDLARDLRIRCMVRPDLSQTIILERLGLKLPERLRVPRAVAM